MYIFIIFTGYFAIACFKTGRSGVILYNNPDAGAVIIATLAEYHHSKDEVQEIQEDRKEQVVRVLKTRTAPGAPK